jgi:hypothetical protein
MEVRAVGSVEEPRLENLLQLLTALAGHEPAPINIHEMTMRCEGVKSRQEVHLRHLMTPATSTTLTTSASTCADRWAVYQYNRPPWSDLEMAKLAATVRTVTQAYCSGPNVPNFYKGLGFVEQYQHFKKGFAFDIQRGTWAIHILVSRLHRVVVRQDNNGFSNSINGGGAEGGVSSTKSFSKTKAAEAVAGEEVAPGHVLIDVWTEVESGKTHTEAIAAIVEVGKQLAVQGVVLQPLPEVKFKPRRQMQQ